ncbi:hypothetical protein T484DRAFT_2876813 [Baffinella frigidus]|nr:hypothetical protein T484DRAFT_2876813 [Cryptophyta sp. CCMP2293]
MVVMFVSILHRHTFLSTTGAGFQQRQEHARCRQPQELVQPRRGDGSGQRARPAAYRGRDAPPQTQPQVPPGQLGLPGQDERGAQRRVGPRGLCPAPPGQEGHSVRTRRGALRGGSRDEGLPEPDRLRRDLPVRTRCANRGDAGPKRKGKQGGPEPHARQRQGCGVHLLGCLQPQRLLRPSATTREKTSVVRSRGAGCLM